MDATVETKQEKASHLRDSPEDVGFNFFLIADLQKDIIGIGCGNFFQPTRL